MKNTMIELNKVRGVGGSLVLNKDGLAIESVLRNDIDDEALSASIGSLVEKADKMCQATGSSEPVSVNVQGENSGLMLIKAGENYLAMVIDPNANLALLQLESQPFIEKIKQLLSL